MRKTDLTIRSRKESMIKFQPRPAHWAAVFSLFMGVTSLISAEFIPVSLLTPMARELSITEGMAGQTVSFQIERSFFVDLITLSCVCPNVFLQSRRFP